MNDDLRDLYQQVILDHKKSPRNFAVLEDATHRADGFNPLCGDKITLYAKVDSDDVIQEMSFQGEGCAISTASASLMTQSLKGKKLGDVTPLFERVHGLMTGSDAGDENIDLGKLEVFSGVREFPMRVKCATLAWHTVKAALDGTTEPVTTE